jgi:predicted nucleic acid-binding protein
MPIDVVVDSSVIAALVTPEQHSEWASKKLAEYNDLHGLDLSYYEVANALKYKKSERFDGKDVVKAFMQAREMLDLCAVHSFSEVINKAVSIAMELDITVYDAAFLSLAERIDAKFLTLDLKLVKKLEGTKYLSLMDYPNNKTTQT